MSSLVAHTLQTNARAVPWPLLVVLLSKIEMIIPEMIVTWNDYLEDKLKDNPRDPGSNVSRQVRISENKINHIFILIFDFLHYK
jgi:hypothetical protein